ncbi:hypothetical protein [Halomicronema sp. CCY15110]|nr:hypothetical protein [Halomicronema sp. CCY15110]
MSDSIQHSQLDQIRRSVWFHLTSPVQQLVVRLARDRNYPLAIILFF